MDRLDGSQQGALAATKATTHPAAAAGVQAAGPGKGSAPFGTHETASRDHWYSREILALGRKPRRRTLGWSGTEPRRRTLGWSYAEIRGTEACSPLRKKKKSYRGIPLLFSLLKQRKVL